MIKKMKKTFLLTIVILQGIFFQETVLAQWSPDPFENQKVRDTAANNVVPHVAINPGGDCYISWYTSTEDLNFDVYMQYFDHQGNKQWPEPGLLLSHHATDTWVSDYDLVADPDGCAVLITQDKRDGFSNAFAYRVSQDGQMKWGPDGIRITDEEYNNYTPQVIVTPDNDYIFLNNMYSPDTTKESMLNLKKIGKEGNLIWDKTLSAGMMDLYWGRMLFTEDNNLMLSYLVKDIYPDTMPGQQHYIHVFLQKFDPEGNSLWPEPVQADSGDVMIYGSLITIPYLANDGKGGAYIAWQSFLNQNPTVLANHIDAGGNLTWPGHGIPVSTNYNNFHSNPGVYYNPGLDQLFIIWQEYHYDDVNLSDCWAVAGQKFSSSGERLWSDTSTFLVPMICSIDTTLTEICLSAGPGNSLFFSYFKNYLYISNTDTTVRSEIYGCLVDQDGNAVWPDGIVPISLVTSEKGDCYQSRFNDTHWIIAWEDLRIHSDDPWNSGIYAQNVTGTGNLGQTSIGEISIDQPGIMLVYPNPFTDEISLEYSVMRKSEISISIYDHLGRCLVKNDLGIRDAGIYVDKLSVGRLITGIYFLKLQADAHPITIKIIKSH